MTETALLKEWASLVPPNNRVVYTNGSSMDISPDAAHIDGNTTIMIKDTAYVKWPTREEGQKWFDEVYMPGAKSTWSTNADGNVQLDLGTPKSDRLKELTPPGNVANGA